MATKRCPYCAEEILAIAIKCKHCGSELGPAGTPAKPVTDYGLFLLVVPVVVMFLIVVWVGNMNMLPPPYSTLSGLVLANVIITALIAAMEVRKNGMSVRPGSVKKNNPGPMNWFLSIVLLWIIAYPLYLKRRASYGLPSRLIAGILIVWFFMGTSLFMLEKITEQSLAIQDKIEQLERNRSSFR